MKCSQTKVNDAGFSPTSKKRVGQFGSASIENNEIDIRLIAYRRLPDEFL